MDSILNDNDEVEEGPKEERTTYHKMNTTSVFQKTEPKIVSTFRLAFILFGFVSLNQLFSSYHYNILFILLTDSLS